MADTQIDELRLDITVEDNTSGESSDKKVKNLATAISRLNKVLGAFDNAKFSKTFENMAKGIEPFVKKIDSVSSALESLATIVKKSGLEKAVEQATSGLSAPEKESVSTGGGGGKEPIRAMGSKSTPFSEAKSDLDEVDDSLRDIDNKWDLLVAKAIEVEKSLDKEKLSAKQILSLVSQRLTIESQLEKLTEAGEKQKIQEATAKQLAEAQKKAESFRDSLTGVTDKVALMKIQLEQVQNALQQGGFTEKQYLTLKKQELKLTEQIAKAEKGGGDDDGKKTEKKATAMGKLVKSFGRIAMYRAVRRAIQEVTQAFTESIDGIAKISPEFRNTMSQLTSDTAKLKASIGVGLYQVLIQLAPTLTDISNAVANFANNLSLSLAILRKSDNYLKVNTDYWKEYQSAINGTLFTFDTFTTLNSSNAIDWDKMFIPSNVSDATEEEIANTKSLIATLETLQSIFQSIGDTLSTLWSGIIKPILTSGATAFILEIVAAIVQFLDKAGLLQTTLVAIAAIWTVEKITGIISSLSKLGGGFTNLIAKIQNYNLQCALAKTKTQILQQTWKSLAVAGAAIAVSVLSIISNWDDMSSKQKGWVIAIAAITAAVAALAFAVYAATQQWAKAISVAAGVITTGVTVAAAVAAFADGGMMTNASGQFTGAGTMYALAGESGAEVVAQGSAGTGVLNVEQFADAMVTALVRYGAARDTGNGTTIELDGNKVGRLVASNVGFRNEANRRNAGLNWK